MATTLFPEAHTTHYPRLDFPKFDGTNHMEWLNLCDDFFCRNHTPPEQKVRIASRYLVGRALQWHQTYMRDCFGLFPYWYDYIIAVSTHFGKQVEAATPTSYPNYSRTPFYPTSPPHPLTKPTNLPPARSTQPIPQEPQPNLLDAIIQKLDEITQRLSSHTPPLTPPPPDPSETPTQLLPQVEKDHKHSDDMVTSTALEDILLATSNDQIAVSMASSLPDRQLSGPELQKDSAGFPFRVPEGPNGYPHLNVQCLGETCSFNPTPLPVESRICEVPLETTQFIFQLDSSSCKYRLANHADSEKSMAAPVVHCSNFSGTQGVRQYASEALDLFLLPAKPPDVLVNVEIEKVEAEDASAISSGLVIVKDSRTRESRSKVHWGNIQASLAVANIIRPPLGPPFMLKMPLDAQGGMVLTNDRNVILRELDVAHPAAKSMIELSRTLDEEVGNETTSIITLAGISMMEKVFIRESVYTMVCFECADEKNLLRILDGHWYVKNKLEQVLATSIKLEYPTVESSVFVTVLPHLSKGAEVQDFNLAFVVEDEQLCPTLPMAVKTMKKGEESFASRVVDAVISFGNDNRLNMIGIKRVPGGTVRDSFLADGLYRKGHVVLTTELVQEIKKGKSGGNLFKYKLVRLADQPSAFSVWNLVAKWKQCRRSRPELILTDIAPGAETQPVSLISEVYNDRGPSYFTYHPYLKYSKPYTSTKLSLGCSCRTCTPGDLNCSCIHKIDKDFPHLGRGILVNGRPMMYVCGPSCTCLDYKNRVSQTGLTFPFEVFKTTDRGWGLRSWIYFEDEPSCTMIASECINGGAALQCAILRPTFNVADFNVNECLNRNTTLSTPRAAALRVAEYGLNILLRFGLSLCYSVVGLGSLRFEWFCSCLGELFAFMFRLCRSSALELMSKYEVNVPKGVAAGSTDKFQKAIKDLLPNVMEFVVTDIKQELTPDIAGRMRGQVLVTAQNGLKYGKIWSSYHNGMTNVCATLAFYLPVQAKRYMLIAGEVYTLAAEDQLSVLDEHVSVSVYKDESTPKQTNTVKRDLAEVKKQIFDIVFMDTDGRLPIDKGMMDKAQNVKRVLRLAEVFLVITTTSGQEAAIPDTTFNIKIEITGTILAKLDGGERMELATSDRLLNDRAHSEASPIARVLKGLTSADREYHRSLMGLPKLLAGFLRFPKSSRDWPSPPVPSSDLSIHSSVARSNPSLEPFIPCYLHPYSASSPVPYSTSFIPLQIGDEYETSGSNNNKKAQWYRDGVAYWQNVEASVDGVLGGYGGVNDQDIKGSEAFLTSILHDRRLQAHSDLIALDCGSGIGRIANNLLLKHFRQVDLLEPVSHFLEAARKNLAPGVIVNSDHHSAVNFFCIPLQEFTPESGRYHVIWVQWCIGHLTDDDFVSFFKRAKTGLRPGGFFILKENIAKTGFVLDKEDRSITRSDLYFRQLFKQCGLHLYKVKEQKGLPEELFAVKMYALTTEHPKSSNKRKRKQQTNQPGII